MDNRIVNFLSKREQARKLSSQQQDQIDFARKFLVRLLLAFNPSLKSTPIEPLESPIAEEMGVLARGMNFHMASYLIGTTYTVMLPEKYRGQYGVFYTPPALVERLLDQAERAGVVWEEARVLDPACGGGAFLAPIAQRMLLALKNLDSASRLRHIEKHLKGFEIDPFSGWITQAFLEILLQEDLATENRPLQNIVEIVNSLETPEAKFSSYDLVIGNPPYGKIKLSSEDRARWSRSLYGHANLYGLFSDLAARLVKPGGVIAYVTPTSFLGGQYFQALRKTLGTETPPVSMDFIARREGVFADALQEVLLSVYKKQKGAQPVNISYLSVMETGDISVQQNGTCLLPANLESPWLLPRNSSQSRLAELSRFMPSRLNDLGYKVSTGPLVWNRHKDQMFKTKKPGTIPLVWAECVDSNGSGRFTFKSTGKNHVPWYQPKKGKDPNIIKESCVLLQRTTTLEQTRRLIVAVLPQMFIAEHGGAVTVENHLNMIRPITGTKPKVSPKVIAALLNSDVVDQIFRCINGSAAVSAYELEAMPLPSPKECKHIESLIREGASAEDINNSIKEMYYNVRIRAAA